MARTEYKYGFSGQSGRFDDWRNWFSDHKWGWDQLGGDDTPSSPTGNGSGSGGTTTPPSSDDNDFAHDLLKLTNDYRTAHGVKPLTWNDNLRASSISDEDRTGPASIDLSDT